MRRYPNPITKRQLEEFEKDFTLKVLANPKYRYGQAFLNYFPWVYRNMENDGDFGNRDIFEIYECSDRNRVLEIADFYIESDDD